MSVHETKRKQSNIIYVQQAQQLCEHTFKLTSHFPDAILASAIKEEVLAILCEVRYTLSFSTKNRRETKKHEHNALAHIDALYALLELAYNNVKPESMEYWIGLVVQLEESIEKLCAN